MWGGDFHTNLLPVITWQAKILRFIGLHSSTNNTTPILLFKMLYIYKCVLFAHKFPDLFSSKNNKYDLRNANYLIVPNFKKELSFKHFCYMAPNSYNKIPSYITDCQNLTKFKKILKNYLLNTTPNIFYDRIQ